MAEAESQHIYMGKRNAAVYAQLRVALLWMTIAQYAWVHGWCVCHISVTNGSVYVVYFINVAISECSTAACDCDCVMESWWQ